MQITRLTAIQGAMLALYSVTQLKGPEQLVPQQRDRVYHPPPVGVSYDDNDTVFGQILRGEIPANTLSESDNLLTFSDIRPRAPLHALVIPKRRIGSVFDLNATTDLPMLYEMEETALKLLNATAPDAYLSGDYTLCFHIPPHNSVDHLHLHVLAPASEMNLLSRWIIYKTGTRNAADLDSVLSRLERGLPSVPYERPPLR